MMPLLAELSPVFEYVMIYDIIEPGIGRAKAVLFSIILDIDFSKFGSSSLTNKSIEIEINRNLIEIGENIPSTYVPARNTVFLSIAKRGGVSVPILEHATGGHGSHGIDVTHYANPLPHVLMLTAIVVMVATLGVAVAVTLLIYRRYKTLEEDEILMQIKKG